MGRYHKPAWPTALAAKDFALYSPYVSLTGLLLCLLWFFHLLRYSKYIAAINAVVIEIEISFSYKPFTNAKKILGASFLTFTILEMGIPIAFIIIYIFSLLHFFLQKP